MGIFETARRGLVAGKGFSKLAGFFLAASLMIPVPAYSQAWSGILDPSRATDWSKAGIPGGIPNYTTICQTIPPSGLTDATEMTKKINNALVACSGKGQVVQLQAGTYTINGGLLFNGDSHSYTLPVSNVVLRGAGPDKTILKFRSQNGCNGTWSAICVIGNNGWTHSYINHGGSTTWTGDNGIAGSYSKGDTVIDVGSWTGNAPSVGDIISIDQRNDSIGICPSGGTGKGSCAGVNGATESGTTVTITTSIPHGYSVGQCVGIGDIDSRGSATAYNSGGNTSGSCIENGVTYTGWFRITAVPSSTTFQYTGPRSGLAASGGGYVTTDTGGVFVSDVHNATLDEWASQGRTCPDSSNSLCAAGEISMRSQNEIKRITAINGNQITIDPPLEMSNWRSSQNPGVWWTGKQDTLDGIEDLTYDMSDDGAGSGGGGIHFSNSYECWVKNVRGIHGARNHVWLNNSARTEVVDSYFFGTMRGATQSYGVETLTSSDDLVQNNICQHIVACMMSGQDYGAVFAYNYSVDGGSKATTLLAGGLSFNHDFASLNLFEGNNTTNGLFDNVHGTSVADTLFRNRIRAQDTPLKTDALIAIGNDSFNRAENIIGSVLGTSGSQTPTYEGHPVGWCCGSGSIYVNGVQAEGYNVTKDPITVSSLLRWGNYDVATAAKYPTGVRWCGNSSNPNWTTVCGSTSEIPTTGITFMNGNPVPSSTSLPASFYLSSQPSFWKTPWSTPPWPAIGPDVTGGNAPDGVGGYSYAIPSQLCYLNTSVDPAYQQTFTVTGASWSSGTASLTIGTNRLAKANTITVSGLSPAGYNGIFAVTSATSTTVRYALPFNPGAYTSGGTVTWPNILLFNAANCYPEAHGRPAPPSKVAIVVK